MNFYLKTCKSIANSSWFQPFITGVILLASALVGVETYPAVAEANKTLLHVLDLIILGIFTVEMVIKISAEWPDPFNYFRDPWNVFDFSIVAAGFLPFHTQYVTVLRLVRLLRVLRLLKALPQLRMLVSALLKSLPAMGYVVILLILQFYIYAVAAVLMFGTNDPVRFGSLQISLLTLFQTVTLEGWNDIFYTQFYGCAKYGYESFPGQCVTPEASPILASAFFVSFILIGTMIILNLVIGVILEGMDSARKEIEEERKYIRKNLPLVELRNIEKELIENKIRELNSVLLSYKIGGIRLGKKDPRGDTD